MAGRWYDEHKDRGDGVCVICFEEMPCAVRRGDSLVPLVQADEEEHLRAERREREHVRERFADAINARLEQLNLTEPGNRRDRRYIVQVSHYSTTITMRVEALAKLLSLIPADTPPLPEEEDDEQLW